jgi:hypothetical protein
MYTASCCYILALNAHCIFSISLYFKDVTVHFIPIYSSDATQNLMFMGLCIVNVFL